MAALIAGQEAWRVRGVNRARQLALHPRPFPDRSTPRLEKGVDGPRGRGVDPGRLHQILKPGALDRLHGAEVVKERALARRADAGNLIERVSDQFALALGAVRPDREAMRLVPQALDEVERRVARRQPEGRLSGLEEGFPARRRGRALCDADERDVLTPSASSSARAASSCPLPPSMSTRSGQAGNSATLPSPLRGGVGAWG
jgi:hypothetical protein